MEARTYGMERSSERRDDNSSKAIFGMQVSTTLMAALFAAIPVLSHRFRTPRLTVV
jgi:hypothetical protein